MKEICEKSIERFVVKSTLPIEQIKTLRIYHSENKHGRLWMEVWIKEEEQDFWRENSYLGERISVYETDDPILPVFSCQIRTISWKKRRRGICATIQGVTTSILLEQEKKKQTFQNTGSSYEEVVRQALNGQSVYFSWYLEKNKPIQEPIFQYEEDDWSFLKRLASQFHSSLVVDARADFITIEFGKRIGEERSLEKAEILEYGFRERYYQEKIFVAGYAKNQVLFLKLKERAIWQIGDFVWYLGEQFFIYQREFEIKQGEFWAYYTLGTRGFLWKQRREPRSFAGATLMGTVRRTEGERITVQFDLDREERSGYGWEWVPETGNMSYCMPEVGTKVAVYFPTKKEVDGRAIYAFSEGEKERAVSQRELVTAENKHLGLWAEELFLQGEENALKVSLKDKKGIGLASNHALHLEAGGAIEIKASRILANACVDLICETETSNIEISRNFNFYSPNGVQTRATEPELEEKKEEELFGKEEKEVPYRQAMYAALGAIPAVDLKKADASNLLDLIAIGGVAKIGSGEVTIAMRDVMDGVPEKEARFAEALETLDLYTFKGAHPSVHYTSENRAKSAKGKEQSTRERKMQTDQAKVRCSSSPVDGEDAGGRAMKKDFGEGNVEVLKEEITSRDIRFDYYSKCGRIPECDVRSTNAGTNKTFYKNHPLTCRAQIEGNKWMHINEEGAEEESIAVVENESYMFCYRTCGLIYLTQNGERNEELEEKVAEVWIEKWKKGEMRDGNSIDYSKVKWAAEIINEKGKLNNYTNYITLEQIKKVGFNELLCTPFMALDLNRVCKKFEITSQRRLEFFLATSVAEGGGAADLGVDGFPIETGDYEYYSTDAKEYYPYIGVGYVQLTTEAGYLAFAIYKATEAHKELYDELNQLDQYTVMDGSPAHKNTPTLKSQYTLLKTIAREKGISIAAYQRIYEPQNVDLKKIKEEIEKFGDGMNKDTNERVQLVGDATYYTAKYFPWEASGYYWKYNEINELIDANTHVSDEAVVNKITDIVNLKSSIGERRRKIKIHENIKKLNIVFGTGETEN